MTDRPTDSPTDRPTAVAIAQPTDRPTRSAAVGTDRPTDSSRVGTDESGLRRLFAGLLPDRPTDRPAPTDRLDESVPTDPTDESATDPTDREPWPLRVGLAGALWVISTVTSLMAAQGQLWTADQANIRGFLRFGVPIELDLFAVTLLLLGYREGRRGRSPYPLWLLACVPGGVGIYMNLNHGGRLAGIIFGAASAGTLISWTIKLWLDLRHYQEVTGRRAKARPKLGVLWLVSFPLARKAWVIATRCRLTSTDEAVENAEVWRDIYHDLRNAAVERKLAKRTAWRIIKQRCGVPVVELPRSVQVETVAVSVRPADESTDSTGNESVPTESVTDRPTDSESVPTDYRPAGYRPTGYRPTARPTDRGRSTGSSRSTSRKSTVHLDWSPTVIENARILRERYGDDLPDLVAIRNKKTGLGWSYDKAKPAIAAYKAGADLLTNDDKEQAA